MAYIGRQLVRGENRVLDDISSSFNGSTTLFNLTVASSASSPGSQNQLWISVGGVMQHPGTDFTVAGSQVTFTTAPASGLSFWGLIQGDQVSANVPSDGSITPGKLGGQDFAFTGDIRLNDGDGSHYVGFQAPTTVSTNKIWTLPAADGSANQYLKTDGSGTLSWGSDSTSDPSKMPLAGGTFTGDVTFTGDASNGLWDKSASAFVANLTGTASGNAVLTGSTNNTIATVTGANALAGEANLTFDGTTLKTVNTDGSAAIALSRTFSGNVASATNTPPLTFTLTDTATSNQVIASISPQGAAGTGDAFNGNMRFYTANDAGTNTERMRIDNLGNLSVGGTSPSTQSAKLQAYGTSQNGTRINMHHEGNSSASISANGGLVLSADGSNGTTERFRVGTSGQLGIGGATYGTSGQVLTSGGASAAPQWATPSAGAWTKIASGSVTSGTARTVTTNGITSTYEHYKLIFHCINESGQQFGIDVSTNGGSSWVSASGSNYSINYFGHYNGSNMNGGDNGRPFAELKTGANSDNYSGYITFSGAHRTDEVHSFQSSFSAWNNGNTRHGIYQCALAYKATTAFNGIRFMSDASGDGWSLLTYTLLGCEM